MTDVTDLGDRVVDIHGRDGEFARLGQLIEPVHTSDTFLYNALHHAEHGRVLLEHQVGRISPIIQDLVTAKCHTSQGQPADMHFSLALTVYKSQSF